MKWLYLPFLFQGLAMFADEFYFHEKRGLPAWEKIGHPLDTLTVLACFTYLLMGKGDLSLYVVLCGFSCLFITKDEFVHKERCSGSEQWLHALLFVLHPLSFLSAYLLFKQNDLGVLRMQSTIIISFMAYQIFRWSIPWRAVQK